VTRITGVATTLRGSTRAGAGAGAAMSPGRAASGPASSRQPVEGGRAAAALGPTISRLPAEWLRPGLGPGGPGSPDLEDPCLSSDGPLVVRLAHSVGELQGSGLANYRATAHYRAR
jgi:hypothetical protein